MVADNSFSERTVLCSYPKLTFWVQNISQIGPQKTKCLQLAQSYFFAVPEKMTRILISETIFPVQEFPLITIISTVVFSQPNRCDAPFHESSLLCVNVPSSFLSSLQHLGRFSFLINHILCNLRESQSTYMLMVPVFCSQLTSDF